MFRRGARTVVALNLSDAPQVMEGVDGTVTLATDRAREGTAATGTVTLAPWSGVVLET